MNARPIWTQSGTGPKFIRSRVNGTLVFCKFTCPIYFFGDKFALILQIFDYIFACKIRLVQCKILLYRIWKCFEAIVMFWGYSDSLVFSLDTFAFNQSGLPV